MKRQVLQNSANVMDKKAGEKVDIMTPVEDRFLTTKKKLADAMAEVNLARSSESQDAIRVATNNYDVAKKSLTRARVALHRLGPTPEALRERADQLRKKAEAENDIMLSADKSAEEFRQTEEESEEAAKESLQAEAGVKNDFLPKVLRHTHRRVAFIEHALAKQLSALKKLGMIQPSAQVNVMEAKADEELRKKLLAEKHMNLKHLKLLRKKVNAMRKTAGQALEHANKVMKETEAADKKIKTLKKEACKKAKDLQKTLDESAPAGAALKDLQGEVKRAASACEQAGETFKKAQADLKMRAQDVATSTKKVAQLESRYAADQAKIETEAREEAQKAAVEKKVYSEDEQEKLTTLAVMIRQAKGKLAEAKLLGRKADETKDPEDTEVAEAHLAAAQHHLAELRGQKAMIVNSGSKEVNSGDTKDVKPSTDYARATELGDEQHSTLGASSAMQNQVNALTTQLARAQQSSDENAKMKVEMEQMRSKLDAIDRAAASVLTDLDGAITKGGLDSEEAAKDDADVENARNDAAVADDQLSKLDELKKTAEDKVKEAESTYKTTGAAADKQKLDKAREDLQAVVDADSKVENRKEADQALETNQTAAASAVRAADKAIGRYAMQIKGKFQRLKDTTNSAKQSDVTMLDDYTNNTSPEVLEQRITALEAAVSIAGGDVEGIEDAASGMTGSAKNIQEKIEQERAKLEDVKQQISSLDGKLEQARAASDSDQEIEYGTKQKDLEVEEENIKESLKDLYAQLERSSPADVTMPGSAKLSELISGTTASNDTASNDTATNSSSPQVSELLDHQEKLKSALQEAKAASEERKEEMAEMAAVRKKLQSAVEAERTKIDVAKQAKESLVEKMDALSKKSEQEKQAVTETKDKLSQDASNLEKEQLEARQRQQAVAQVKGSMEEFHASLNELVNNHAAIKVPDAPQPEPSTRA